MIVIIDYGIGNLGSVLKAFQYLKIPVKLTKKSNDIKKARGIVLPGVGAFGAGMSNLKKANLDQLILKIVTRQIPFLGICLGMQLLFTASEEDKGIEGLNLIKGKVKKFSYQEVPKIPHMGWNQVSVNKKDSLFRGLKKNSNFYFVHSYYVTTEHKEVILGKTRYGKREFISVLRKDNIWGFQCHPEKSSRLGLRVLKNFSEVVFNGSNSGN